MTMVQEILQVIQNHKGLFVTLSSLVSFIVGVCVVATLWGKYTISGNIHSFLYAYDFKSRDRLLKMGTKAIPSLEAMLDKLNTEFELSYKEDLRNDTSRRIQISFTAFNPEFRKGFNFRRDIHTKIIAIEEIIDAINRKA